MDAEQHLRVQRGRLPGALQTGNIYSREVGMLNKNSVSCPSPLRPTLFSLVFGTIVAGPVAGLVSAVVTGLLVKHDLNNCDCSKLR
jgi:hypothetical protein